jgi:Transcription termination and cleavage factor C-terminal
MLLQVLRLTQEQIGQLPPAERDAILALVSSPCEMCDSCLPIRLDSDPNLVTLHDWVVISWGGDLKGPIKHFWSHLL